MCVLDRKQVRIKGKVWKKVIFVQGEERRQRAGKKNEEEEERQINKVIQVLIEARAL